MAKIFGMLENAQFELLATAPAVTPSGRVYCNTTISSAVQPYMYNGTAWRPLLLGQASSLISQNSGTACTVDWSTGLNQQVNLTGHCTISFINPQAGSVHRLAVTQIATEASGTLPWMHKLAMSDQYTRRTEYQPRSVIQSSESKIYTWFYSAGIKPAYATIPIVAGAPIVPPSTTSLTIDVHPFYNTVSLCRSTSPYHAAITYFDAGSKLYWGVNSPTTPSTLIGAAVAAAYSPDGQVLVIASATSPYYEGIPVDNNGVASQTVWSAATALSGAGYCVAMHPSGSHALIGHATTPFMTVAAIGQGMWGTQTVASGAYIPAGAVTGAAFSPTGDYLAVVSASTPFLQVIPFSANGTSAATLFGSYATNPGTLPAGGSGSAVGKIVAWHPSGNWIAMGIGNNAPYVYVVPFSRAAGTFGVPVAISASGTAPVSTITCLQFSPCGNYLVIGNQDTISLFVYDFNTWGTTGPIAFTGTGPSISTQDIAFDKSGEILFCAIATTPYVSAYYMPRKAKNYMKLLE